MFYQIVCESLTVEIEEKEKNPGSNKTMILSYLKETMTYDLILNEYPF